MKKLNIERQAAILRCLVEGNSINSTSRITGAAPNTIADLLRRAGEACADYQDRHMINLPCTNIQLDEIWSFVGCRDKNKENAIGKHPGDVWTWTAICADTKLIPSWRVGDRSGRTAYAFCHDLSKRFANPFQITADGHPAYVWAVKANFEEVKFAQYFKVYEKNKQGMDVVVGVEKRKVCGDPDMATVSTSYVERSNLTIRMGNRRFTRKTNAFSKDIDRHRDNISLSLMHYNFCRVHMTTKTTPAIAANLTDHRWTIEEIVMLIDAYFQRKLEQAFLKAFDLKFTKPRTIPKTFTPQKPKLPWYLDVNSGGRPEN